MYLTLLGDLAWRLFSGESSAVDSTTGLTGYVLGAGSNGFNLLVFFSLGGGLTALLASGSQLSSDDSRCALVTFCCLWENLSNVLFSLFFCTAYDSLAWLPFCLFKNSSINFLLPSGSVGSFFIEASCSSADSISSRCFLIYSSCSIFLKNWSACLWKLGPCVGSMTSVFCDFWGSTYGSGWF